MLPVSLRKEVLSAFKQLHRTSQIVFKNDDFALNAARVEINKGFSKNKHVNNLESVKELLLLSQQIEDELRTTVVQTEEVEPGKYQVHLRPEVRKLDNLPPPYNQS